MSLTTQFVGELIRAANQVEKLNPLEVKRLLNRSIATIRDMREQIGIPASNRVKKRADSLPAADARDALLDAADIIRTLKIVLDGKE
ncbi:hypothetical protein [Sinorhizobium fredii]|uniref:hypothetical protein n=1 Tax=Rhizobium fredii TaxID=380 RepID=UPI0004BC5293|nr:hypothetical protein [Sinorhizobium fredii]